jgi:GAF domain-containing protein
VGTCAAAAATGEVVVTCDFTADEKWAELRHLPLALGFVGAWSTPIKGGDGRVLGTFGVYNRESRVPTDEERKAMGVLAEAAAQAIISAA